MKLLPEGYRDVADFVPGDNFYAGGAYIAVEYVVGPNEDDNGPDDYTLIGHPVDDEAALVECAYVRGEGVAVVPGIPERTRVEEDQ